MVVGFDRNINYYKIQMATLCIRENPGCMFIATNTGGWPGWRGAGGLGGATAGLSLAMVAARWLHTDRHAGMLLLLSMACPSCRPSACLPPLARILLAAAPPVTLLQTQ